MPDDYDEMSDEEFEADEERGRRWSEGPLGEAFRKALEKGIEAGVVTLNTANEAWRGVTQDGGKLPKEVIGYVFSQVDETKNALVRGVAGEVRDFLEATDIAGEFYRALTSLSFEIKTEIRFIPNDAGGVRPQVKASAVPKRARRDRRRSKAKAAAAAAVKAVTKTGDESDPEAPAQSASDTESSGDR